jgi:hypothetical protein
VDGTNRWKFWLVDDDEEGIQLRWWLHRIPEDEAHPWRHYRVYLNDRMSHQRSSQQRAVEGHIEWRLFHRPGFGVGFKFGRNGSESDVGLDLYAGPIGSAWMRLRSPWTRWARIERKGEGDKDWYKARHYGVRLFPHRGLWFTAEWDAREGEWSRDQPWWREVKFGAADLWGRTRSEKLVEDSGECVIPMPEGVYPATWERAHYERSHVRWPGTWLDRVKPSGNRSTVSIRDVPGGIPHWGKGDNSWDCGMDGGFGIHGGFQTVEAAIGAMVESSLRDRRKYGGPHDLPHPMTVTEAEQWALAERGTA